MLNSVRDSFIKDRTATANRIHAALLEVGISLPKGFKSLNDLATLIDEKPFPSIIKQLLKTLHEHFDYFPEAYLSILSALGRQLPIALADLQLIVTEYGNPQSPASELQGEMVGIPVRGQPRAEGQLARPDIKPRQPFHQSLPGSGIGRKMQPIAVFVDRSEIQVVTAGTGNEIGTDLRLAQMRGDDSMRAVTHSCTVRGS